MPDRKTKKAVRNGTGSEAVRARRPGRTSSRSSWRTCAASPSGRRSTCPTATAGRPGGRSCSARTGRGRRRSCNCSGIVHGRIFEVRADNPSRIVSEIRVRLSGQWSSRAVPAVAALQRGAERPFARDRIKLSMISGNKQTIITIRISGIAVIQSICFGNVRIQFPRDEDDRASPDLLCVWHRPTARISPSLNRDADRAMLFESRFPRRRKSP